MISKQSLEGSYSFDKLNEPCYNEEGYQTDKDPFQPKTYRLLGLGFIRLPRLVLSKPKITKAVTARAGTKSVPAKGRPIAMLFLFIVRLLVFEAMILAFGILGMLTGGGLSGSTTSSASKGSFSMKRG